MFEFLKNKQLIVAVSDNKWAILSNNPNMPNLIVDDE